LTEIVTEIFLNCFISSGKFLERKKEKKKKERADIIRNKNGISGV
jgi:hypothetical protein